MHQPASKSLKKLRVLANLTNEAHSCKSKGVFATMNNESYSKSLNEHTLTHATSLFSPF